MYYTLSLPPDIAVTGEYLSPPHTSPPLLPYSPASRIEGSFGSITMQEEDQEEFLVRLSSFQINHPLKLLIRAHQPSVSLTYVLQGQSTFPLHGYKEPVDIEEGIYYLMYLPAEQHSIPLEPGNYRIVQIELPEDIILALSHKYFEIHDVNECRDRRYEHPVIYYVARINGRVKELVQQLLHNTLEEEERSICQHARVLDLLVQMTDYLLTGSEDEMKTPPSSFNFTPEDLKAIREAGDLKVARMGDAPALREIARAKGMHPKKLQEGFKHVFGCNPRDLTIEAKMETAKRLLKEDKLSLEEIAFEIGYSNASSFVRAFRNYAGITPAAYKKQ